MLTKAECQEIHKKAQGRVWLEHLAANDGRLKLYDESGTCLHCWWNAEFDDQEQSQAARLCAFINDEWRAKQRAKAASKDTGSHCSDACRDGDIGCQCEP